ATALSGKISITTADGTATSTGTLTVIHPPKPTVLAPTTAAVGSVVTISGTSLDAASAVMFTGPVTVTPTAVTATTVKVVVLVGAQTGVVAVTNPAGTGTTTAVLKVQPRIDSFTPGSVVGGSATLVSVNGLNLRAATGVPVVKVGTF